jgi:hypothetical protein
MNQDGTISGDYTLKQIVGLDKDLSCELRRSDQSSSIVGAVVISQGNARGDFDISTEAVDMPFASHFILQDDIIYTWTSLAKVGYKSAADRALPQGGVVGLQDKAPYTCAPWNADLTRFQLPSGINFQEVD